MNRVPFALMEREKGNMFAGTFQAESVGDTIKHSAHMQESNAEQASLGAFTDTGRHRAAAVTAML